MHRLSRGGLELLNTLSARNVDLPGSAINHLNPPWLSRGITQRSVDSTQLSACEQFNGYRPRFRDHISLHGNIRGGRYDKTQIAAIQDHEKAHGERQYLRECYYRLQGTGLHTDWKGQPAIAEGRVEDPYNPDWSHPLYLRFACYLAYTKYFSPITEINARKLCAKIKDQRYPSIYHSLEDQSHALYILGRLELEREEIFHPLAWYMLTISAGLGQLDAALLLHQLEKVKPQLSLQAEQRALITKAADQKLDWRAMAAQAEHIMIRERGRTGRRALSKQKFAQCAELVTGAMERTSPNTCEQIKRGATTDGVFNVETLETMQPPYRLLLDLCMGEMSAGNNSAEISALSELATKTGALEYHDPKVAWLHAVLLKSSGRGHTDSWTKCVEMAARDCNADACFQLARYYFERDGWYPSLAQRVSDDMEQQWREHIGAEGLKRPTEEGKSAAVLSQRQDKLLNHQEGLKWMKIAARLHIDSAVKMLNRYCIAAALLRQNGFLREGKEVLVEAKNELKNCTDDFKYVDRALRTLENYLEQWESRSVYEVPPIQEIENLLKAEIT